MTTIRLAKKQKKIDYTLASVYLAAGMTYKEAAEKLGCTRGSLEVGMSTKRLTQAARSAQTQFRQLTSPANVLKTASDLLRNNLSSELERTIGALSKVPTKASLKGLKARTDVLEPLARTARIVHDWGNTTVIGLVDSTTLKQAEVIDVSNEPLGEPKNVTPTLPETCDSEKT